MRITVDLSWQAHTEPDLAGYKVMWAGGGSMRGVLVQKTVTAMRLSVHVKPRTVYEFTYQAFDIAGNESEKRPLAAVYVE